MLKGSVLSNERKHMWNGLLNPWTMANFVMKGPKWKVWVLSFVFKLSTLYSFTRLCTTSSELQTVRCNLQSDSHKTQHSLFQRLERLNLNAIISQTHKSKTINHEHKLKLREKETLGVFNTLYHMFEDLERLRDWRFLLNLVSWNLYLKIFLNSNFLISDAITQKSQILDFSNQITCNSFSNKPLSFLLSNIDIFKILF